MRSLPVFDPFVEIERMFDGLWPARLSRTPAVEGHSVPLDVYEQDDSWVVRASLPGVKSEDVDVQIENGVLTLRGQLSFESEHKDAKVYRREIASGSFARSVRLPENVDPDKVEATFANGLVTVTIPKTPADKPAAIKVPVRAIEGQTE